MCVGSVLEPADVLAEHCDVDDSVVYAATIGGGDCPTTSKRALKQRAKRKRKQRDSLMVAVKGNCIEQARANSKAISLEELLAVEGFLHLENQLPMRPSRRRRRLAWCLWLGEAENAGEA